MVQRPLHFADFWPMEGNKFVVPTAFKADRGRGLGNSITWIDMVVFGRVQDKLPVAGYMTWTDGF